ncbi:cyclopropane-fatty-acyl-phospholipid synthase family protein [Candidatus Albibeggiatoa sp. nov. NOAA]|uniref:cyclopropane-fatty-acyl-phospholipid synthase family protein n=1 Tax=Candidatus Albibeggiatoa sp. nov. NOAA TaxID=3162724 RepID=UPI0032F133BD|nr:cyclopropane-fatty-acyl-phospholipid synthase family protein [Thiotrichaceae bacterium]
MNEIAIAANAPSEASFFANKLRGLFLKKLQALQGGTLVLTEGNQTLHLGQGEPKISIAVNNPEVWTRLVLGGRNAAGETYVDGDWDCDDLLGFMRLLLSNRPTYNRVGRGFGLLSTPIRALRKWRRRNTRNGSQRNISSHYDIGNAFYRLWLDDTMMYSCALFERPDMSLHEASLAKLEAICQKLELKASDHVLEIGTGWGGFALYAASHYGCKVTTITISKEQYTLAKQRIEQAQLEHLVKVELKDYRDVQGQYDKLVNIEMVEAVGEAYLNTFVGRCGDLLKPDGVLLIQTIVMAEHLFEDYKGGEDFIQKHIFPGGFLPSTTLLVDTLTKTTDLRLAQLDDMGMDYALTLEHWRKRFMDALDELPALGFDERFVRLWEYYLCYCECGFRERTISAIQMKCVKPQWR